MEALVLAATLGGVSLALGVWVRSLRANVRLLQGQLQDRSTKLRAFAVELIRAEEEQRSRIARELHDGLGQLMTAVNIELQVLREAAPEEVKLRVDDVRALAAQVTTEMRRISHELRPAVLDEMGLAEAVKALAERMARHCGIAIDVDVGGNVDVLPADTLITCYRLVQEALNNVVRHSGAARAAVRLERDAARLEVSVVDDGRGIDYTPATAQDGHFGLLGLEERINALGGRFSVRRRPEGGTRVAATLPAQTAQ